ncbi:chloride channel protein [Fluviicola taffensis]|uniref:Cl-channel voltage-gated family protein n=1 Tax=Fluviicola taffensis (strain DSM 16823 / NCIMB 13979 / RW262) TaxID=755732 RepID=F2IE73_FLUTR|nr:chloride channel protein [Fluviicola taffensis]AEA42391.1 Cl- channel voltage-gated family protein [Fluviicola taffensis DSM 16823]
MLSRFLRKLNGGIFFLRNSLTPRQFLLLSSVIVGLSSALAVIVLKSFAHMVLIFAKELNQQLHFKYVDFILPVFGIVLTIFITRKLLNGKLEKGTWRIIYAINKKSSIMPRKQMYAQVITSSVTVGFGGSAGLESPVTITGAAFGSNYARVYKLSTKERTLLLACGVAAGIAAAFNAPIAGVLFTMEVLLADVGITAFIPLMLASASGALLSAAVLNESILLSFKNMAVFELQNVPFYIVLGVLTGFIAVYHNRVFNRIETWMEHWKMKAYQKGIVGALLLSTLIFIFPSLFGEGYDSIRSLSTEKVFDLLDGTLFESFKQSWFPLVFIGAVVFLKAIATGLTLGSGGNGGNFAPSLFVGSYTGFAFAYGWNLAGIGFALPITNFTMVGMAGLLSGLFHAPLTAIFLIAEITGGYGLMIPLMIVSSISFAISKRYLNHSMDIVKLADEGHVVRADKDRHILSSIDPADILEETLVVLNPTDTVSTLFLTIQYSHQALIPIVSDSGMLLGMIYLDDLPTILPVYSSEPNTPLELVMEPIRYSLNPRNTLEQVMEMFERSKLNYLPVIDNDQVLGYYSKSRLLEAYRKKIMDSMVE